MTASTQSHLHTPQAALGQIIELLNKNDLTLSLARKQKTSPRQELVENLVEKQQSVKIRQRLERMHPADIAYILENLAPERRKIVWSQTPMNKKGAVLLEVADGVRDFLLADMNIQAIMGLTKQLDSDEIVDLVQDLPRGMVLEILENLESHDRQQVQILLDFPEHSVGGLMDVNLVAVRDDVSVDVVLRYLRRKTNLPDNIHQVFVVDAQGVLLGILPLKKLLTSSPETHIAHLLCQTQTVFYTTDTAHDAALVFERYGLLSAPVVNAHQQLVGNLQVDEVVAFMHKTSQHNRLTEVGLSSTEDLFAPIWQSSRARWPWLAINLLTAFVASRVIGMFEEVIVQLVALAALMPIVASIGGNCANQTVALMLKGITLKQLNHDTFRHLAWKELSISLINGVIWGSVVGLFSLIFYQQIPLALVLLGAMVLTLLIAALSGLFFPLLLLKLGRDPIMGSTVIVTSLTDSMGFFIFLALASFFLI